MPTTPSHRHREDVALFRFGLVAQIIACPPGPARKAVMVALAAKHHTIPGTTRTVVAEGTLKDWVRLYENAGYDGLLPKQRADRAKPRQMSAEISEVLLDIKRTTPGLSVRQIIATAYQNGDLPADVRVAPSTVHRLLTREGLMVAEKLAPAQDLRRFAYRYPNELWQADVMHGPRVPDAKGRLRKTYLLAIIDDATRVIPYAQFAFTENAGAFIHVLHEAITRRGLPERLYTDNGRNFRSHHLTIVCARLGIALVHARPYHAAGKGKIERWFRTVRNQLLSPLTPETIPDLDTLNTRTRCWIEGEYHMTPHRGLDNAVPLDRWVEHAEHIRFPDPHLDLELLFMHEAQRKVSKVRTVSLNNRLYEVAPELTGQTVTLRYDPSVPPGRPLLVYHNDQPAGTATLLDPHANTTIPRGRPALRFSSDSDDGTTEEEK